ncbi:flagellar protein FliT [Halomonas elongata]|uniref:Flagellar protein FliT n=1 Tax=Halomonas elongata TaxID=2746 RepID=A0A1B8NZN9_HALEL|nr:flagellar protein FliT [Halomonas elongata]OBX35423.1 flagellar protein FliT [Halomonas elongata]
MGQFLGDTSALGEAVLDGYTRLLVRSEHMLEAALAADWETLVAQEADYVQQVERLSTLDAEASLDREARQRKAELLEDILENDLEIRRHLIQRRDELGELIGVSQRQRDLQRAYGAGTSVIDAGSRFGAGSS